MNRRSPNCSCFVTTLICVAVWICTSAQPVLAQIKVNCPDGDRYELNLEQVKLQYQATKWETTLSALGKMMGTVKVEPKTLQVASQATQQWNQFLQALVTGYNGCAISKAEYNQAIQQIIPGLAGDGKELERLRRASEKGRAIDEARLQKVLNGYVKKLEQLDAINRTSIVQDISKEIAQAKAEIIEHLEGQAVIGRVYNEPITLITIGASFGSLKPEEVSIQLITRKAPSIRFDFSATSVTVSVEGFRPFVNPLTPSMAEIAAKQGRYIYFVDLRYLRRAAPSHPLSTLSPANLENAPVHLLLDTRALERLSGLKNESSVDIFMSAEVSGYEFELLSLKLSSDASGRLNAFPMPHGVPGKPGFRFMVGDWRTSNINLRVVGKSLVDDIEQGVEFLNRKSDLAGWRGLWPDKDLMLLFNATHDTPSDESKIVFHPWNQRFVRLREDFASSGGCEVPGIAAFQLSGDIWYLFVTVNYNGDEIPQWTASMDDNTIAFTLNELTTIHNVLRETAILNSTYVSIEDNPIQSVMVIMPRRGKYFTLSLRLYAAYAKALPQPPSDMRQALYESVRSAVTMIRDMPGRH